MLNIFLNSKAIHMNSEDWQPFQDLDLGKALKFGSFLCKNHNSNLLYQVD
jgi:hypothetical protein